MPVALLAYFVAEALAFFAVSKLIGVGWALFWIFGLMAIGALCAAVSLRSAFARAARGRSSVEKLAGDSALLILGWVLSIIPGYVSSALGLLLIFGPTRAVVRRSLTTKLQQRVEDFGVRVYNTSPVSRYTTSYGRFAPQATDEPSAPRATDHPVIDADELERWFRMDGGEPGSQPGSQPGKGA